MSMHNVEILRAACCVAAHDDRISEEESAMLRKLAGNIGVGEMSLNAMIDRATQDAEFYREQFEILKGDAERTMRILLSVAAADRDITDGEHKMLGHFAEQLGMSADRYKQYVTAWRQKLSKGT